MAHGHQTRVGSERRLSLVDRFDVVLDRAQASMAGAIIHRMSLRQTVATPEGKRRYVRTLFATIADRYDLITVILSYGRDRAWKRRLVRMAGAHAGIAPSTSRPGPATLRYLLHDAGARVVGLDVSARMIELATAKRDVEPGRDSSSAT